jgi:hypothetical protein
MPNGVRVDASDLRKVAKIAKAYGPELQKQLRKQLRLAGKLGADAAKEGIREMPSNSDGTSTRYVAVSKRGRVVEKNLRDLIADAVTVNVGVTNRPDIRIRIRRTPALNDIGAGGIAKAINSGRWKHPVFGNRKVWVQQKGIEFFDHRIEARREEMKILVKAALDDAARIAAERGIL